MLFNSLIFIYLFLPLSLLVYYLTNERYKNLILLLSSFIFFAWGGVSYSFLLVLSTLINYTAGILLGKTTDKRKRKIILATGIVLNLFPLILFKYTGFFTETLNVLTSVFGIKPLTVAHFILPLGISFYSFKAITYLMSVHRNECPVQKNYIDLALFISIFPQVIAGPIDRYRNLEPQLRSREYSFELMASGIKRFALGLGKKVLIANTLGIAVDEIFHRPPANLGMAVAWLGALAYTLQIYYDFSGYTDMAIGIGRMFGFNFIENFNFPYRSKNVKEFWQRWHMSLSNWLRDYLYLPLAYSTSRKLKEYKYMGIRADYIIYIIATAVTFTVCGFWHGAAWGFIVWGMLHGLFLVFEQLGLRKFLKHRIKLVQHAYLLLFISISWVVFRSANLDYALHYIGIMFGIHASPANWDIFMEFINPGFIAAFAVAVAGSTSLFEQALGLSVRARDLQAKAIRGLSVHFFEISVILMILFIMAVSTLFILAGTNNSFIYFQF